jgi:hypothetical protein
MIGLGCSEHQGRWDVHMCAHWLQGDSGREEACCELGCAVIFCLLSPPAPAAVRPLVQ